MGLTAFEIFGVLKLDSDQFNKGLSSAETKLGAGIAGAAKMGAVAIGAATAAAVGFGKSSIDAATSFESAFTGVRKTVDATEEEFGVLSDWIMEASTRMASSKESIAGTMEIAGQLGIDGVEALEKFTETMVMLGDTTNLSSEEAAGALARFMNITGDSAENADRIGSVIVDLGNHFATTESDIVQMSTRLASAGTIAGLSANDILALSTAMSSVGIQAEAGGTAMSQTLAKMSKAVDGGGESLEQFAMVAGMSAEQFAATWKGAPIDAVQAFIGGLGRINEADESVIMTLEELGLKGIRQTNMLQALALSSEMLGGAVNMANDAYEKNIALSEEANLRYGTTESAAVQTAEAFKNLKVAIGEELLPVYSDLMSFSKVAMESMTAGFQEGGLEGLMGSLGTALSDGLNMVVQKLPDILNAGMQLVGALGQGILDNLPIIIDAAIQIVKQLVAGLIEALPAVVDGALQIIIGLANGLAEMMPTLIPAVVEIVMQIAQTLVDNLPLLLDAALNLAQGIIDGLLEAIPMLYEQWPKIVQSLVDAMIKALPTLIQGVIQLVLGIVNALPQIIQTIVAAIPQIISALVDGFVTALPLLIDGAIQLILGIVDALPEIILALIDAIPVIITSIIEALIKAIPQLVLGAIQLVAGIVAHLPEIIAGLILAIPEIIMAIIDGFSAIGEPLKEVFSGAWERVKEIFADPGAFFTEKFEQAKEAASTAWSGIVDFFQETKQRQEEVFADVGTWATNKFTEARENAKLAWGEIIQFFQLSRQGQDAIFQDVGAWFGDRFTEAKTKVQDVMSRLPEIFRDILGRIKSVFANIGEWFAEVGRNIVQGLKNGIEGAWSNFKDWFSGLFGDLTGIAKNILGIQSPSKVFKWIGQMIDEGLAIGVTSNLGIVNDAMDTMASSVIRDLPIGSVADINGVGGAYGSGGFTQYLTINSPRELNPSEIARQTRNANREMVLRMRTV